MSNDRFTRRHQNASEHFEKVRPTFAIGLGGTGGQFLATFSNALAEHRVQFGEVAPELGVFVDAVEIDSDYRSWIPGQQPYAADLVRSGAKKVHLTLPRMGEVMAEEGYDEVLPEGSFVTEHDPNGCKTLPNNGAVMWAERVKTTNPDENPLAVFGGMIRRFRDYEAKDHVITEDAVDVVIVGSGAGGTGTGLMTDAATQIAQVFRDGLPGKQVNVLMFIVTPESADADPVLLKHGGELVSKRRFNYGALMLRHMAACVKGYSTDATDANIINGVPANFTFVMNGNSGSRQLYRFASAPRVLGRAIAASITGKDDGSALSNFTKFSTGITAPHDEFDIVPKNIGAIAFSEIVPNPSRAVRLRNKRLATLNAATGCNVVLDDEVAERVTTLRLKDGVSALVDSIIKSVRRRPQLDDEALSIAKEASANAGVVAREFTRAFDRYELNLRAAALELVNSDEDARGSINNAVETAFGELQDERKIGTLKAVMSQMSEQVAMSVRDLHALLQVEATLINRDTTRFNEATRALSNASYSVFSFGKDARKIQGLSEELSQTANRLRSSRARYEVAKALYEQMTGEEGMVADVRSALDQTNAILQDIDVVSGSVIASARAEDAVVSPFDIKKDVPMTDYSGLTTNANPGDYTVEELTELVEAVTLTGDEVNVEGELDEHVIDDWASRAQPVIREPFRGAHKGSGSTRKVITANLELADVMNEEHAYDHVLVLPGGPTALLQAKYGVKATGCAYTRGVFNEMIETALKDPAFVAEHFRSYAEMKENLTFIADFMAEEDKERAGERGEIRHYPVEGGRFGYELPKFHNFAELRQMALQERRAKEAKVRREKRLQSLRGTVKR